MNRLMWKLNRLRTMSPREIGYRSFGILRARLEQAGLGTAARAPLPALRPTSSHWLTPPRQIEAANYLEAADAICQGTLKLFSRMVTNFNAPFAWNRDPKTGIRVPLDFGKTLDYRNPDLVGDIKYLWEPNRHLHLLTLGQAWFLSKDPRYLACLRQHLTSWLDQCPYLRGPNWTSSLELGIRLINWSAVWQLIDGVESPLFDGAEGNALRDRWLRSIYQHADFIQSYFSRFSSANNHLIGEATGLFVATSTWPYWPEFEFWRARAQSIVEREAFAQNTSDGVNREQAISYQQFVLDFLLIAGLTARTGGEDFSSAYWQRIEAMLEYLASLMDVSGNLPMLGDADDGKVVALSQAPDCDNYRSLLATGAVLFDRGDFKAKAGALDDKTRWLLGSAAVMAYENLAAEHAVLPVRRAFPEGGYYILGTNFETPNEIKMVVDAGPLGYKKIAAHGHADALSITLSVGGREFLVDPGTYAYHTEKKWRDYFRGTSAHNTVRIDEENQSLIGGNFMWLHHAMAWCDRWEMTDAMQWFSGWHDGYRWLKDSVSHRREIEFDTQARTAKVTDHILCRSRHTLEGFWHFSDACEVARSGHVITAVNHPQRMTLTLPQGADEIFLAQGDEQRPAGWISRAFDAKSPAPTVGWKKQIEGEAHFVSHIAIG